MFYTKKHTQKRLDKVKNLLPAEKPYPKFIHKKIAKELNYRNNFVWIAIKKLSELARLEILEQLTMVELRKLAKWKKVKPLSKLRKKELIDAIREASKDIIEIEEEWVPLVKLNQECIKE